VRGARGEGNHFANELMPENTCIRIIAFHQFKVCAANARLANFDQSLVVFKWLRNIT